MKITTLFMKIATFFMKIEFCITFGTVFLRYMQMCENVRKCAEMCALTDGLAPQLASDPVAFFAEK